MYFRRQGGAGVDEVQLFDGDRIAVLAALLVTDLLESLPADDQRAAPTVRPPKELTALQTHGISSKVSIGESGREETVQTVGNIMSSRSDLCCTRINGVACFTGASCMGADDKEGCFQVSFR